jgi:prepilin-type N-terminal cleavage/methylation domain-containing protein
MSHERRLAGNRSGFTIVELLISTVVFSVILLAVTIGIMQITRVYYKGINEANTQDVARGIMDTISQAIQFSGGTVYATQGSAPGASTSFCIGNEQFSYKLGYQLVESSPGTNQTTKALWQSTTSGCTGNPAAAASGIELLSPKMRLSNLTVSQVNSGDANLWKVSVRVVYGDDDLLSNPTATNASCKGSAGQQFCSVSELTTTVVKRVGN